MFILRNLVRKRSYQLLQLRLFIRSKLYFLKQYILKIQYRILRIAHL